MNQAEYAAWRRENDPKGRTCEYDDRALYAKGLCWPHYKKLHKSGYLIGPPQPPGLHNRKRQALCVRCGQPRGRKKPRTERERTLCRTCIWIRACTICGEEFDANNTPQKHCESCRFDDSYEYWKWWVAQNRADYNRKARSRNSRRRALINGKAEEFTHEDIFDRDGWKCGICNKTVDPKLEHPDPNSPSLDHIIPISRGGSHTRANVRLTHLHCNITRHVGNYDQPIQLALIG